jgi:hypothetical protein
MTTNQMTSGFAALMCGEAKPHRSAVAHFLTGLRPKLAAEPQVSSTILPERFSLSAHQSGRAAKHPEPIHIPYYCGLFTRQIKPLLHFPDFI